jgi:glycosyltransferase involved in cell wall biosynthesis
VLAQEAVELEVIVVDDGSTDGTAALVDEVGDPRVRVIRHEQPRGEAAARNAGVSAAKGSWVAFTDDDDLWAPSYLREQVAAGEATGAGFVYCGAVIFSDDTEAVTPDNPVPSPELVRSTILRWNPLPGGTSAQMVRRDVLLAVGGFDTCLYALSDWDLFIRLTDVASIAAVNKPLVAYRRHAGNMVLMHAKEHLDDFDHLVARHGEAARQRGLEFDGVGYYYWVASGQRRAGRRWSATRIHFNAAVKYRSAGHLHSALRSPLGDWAFGIRSHAPPRPVPSPAWLQELRTPAQPLM